MTSFTAVPAARPIHIAVVPKLEPLIPPSETNQPRVAAIGAETQGAVISPGKEISSLGLHSIALAP